MEKKKTWSDDERNNHFKMIKHKLKNKKIKDELEKYILKIQSIFECDINISLVFNDNEYVSGISDRETFNTEKKMPLADLINTLNSEDKSLYVNIDPIYLKDGINEINNILLTSIDDKLIIIPKID
jgi:hypothetical protein